MAFVFRPAIRRGTEWFEFPRPVPQLRMTETWDVERFKSPLRDGDRVEGHSRNGVDIAIRGQVGSLAGTLTLTEAEMFDALERLREALHVGGDRARFDLYLYHDAGTGAARYFRNCSTLKLEYDLSDERLFTYAASLHAEDARLYRV